MLVFPPPGWGRGRKRAGEEMTTEKRVRVRGGELVLCHEFLLERKWRLKASQRPQEGSAVSEQMTPRSPLCSGSLLRSHTVLWARSLPPSLPHPGAVVELGSPRVVNMWNCSWAEGGAHRVSLRLSTRPPPFPPLGPGLWK